MKKLLVVLALMVFFLSCEKKEEDNSYSITGKVIDNVTGDPIPNVSVYVDVPAEGFTLERVLLAEDWTDAEGLFALKYTLNHSYDFEALKVRRGNIQCTGINGIRYELFPTEFGGGGYTNIDDGGFYLIESFAPAFYRILKPQIPTGWENAYLSLVFGDYLLYPLQFELSNDHMWETLALPQSTCSQSMQFGFGLVCGDSTKTGNIIVDMVYGDTIDIVLPLFD
jgi:hypothetical protein